MKIRGPRPLNQIQTANCRGPRSERQSWTQPQAGTQKMNPCEELNALFPRGWSGEDEACFKISHKKCFQGETKSITWCS